MAGVEACPDDRPGAVHRVVGTTSDVEDDRLAVYHLGSDVGTVRRQTKVGIAHAGSSGIRIPHSGGDRLSECNVSSAWRRRSQELRLPAQVACRMGRAGSRPGRDRATRPRFGTAAPVPTSDSSPRFAFTGKCGAGTTAAV